jgi:hypothetical protein
MVLHNHAASLPAGLVDRYQFKDSKMPFLIKIRNFLFRWEYLGMVMWTEGKWIDGEYVNIASVYLDRRTNTKHLIYG